MRLYFCSLCLILGLCCGLRAQSRYANEWIQYQQSYLKINVSEKGWYRVSFQELQKAGFSAGDLGRLQLFYRGQEVAISVNTTAVEFYGEPNDGGQDSLLYRPFSARPHPYHSLYSDVAAYFLTTGQTAGLRIATANTTSATNLQPELYHVEQQLNVFTQDYSFNNFTGPVPLLQQSYFENGEGWTGGFIKGDSLATWTLKLKNWLPTGPAPRLEMLINGRNDFFHTINFLAGSKPTAMRPFAQLNFFGFKHQRVAADLLATDIGADGQLSFAVQATAKDLGELYSLSYYKVSYPQAFDMAEQAEKTFYLRKNPAGQSLVKIANAPANARAFDLTNRLVPVALATRYEGNTLVVVVPNTAQERKLWITSQSAKTPFSLASVRFEKLDPSLFNYLIVTHPNLRSGANAYAAYRAAVAGGGYRVKTVETPDLFDQFGFGERTPLALRRFADFMLSGGQKPYLMLMGRTVTFPDILKSTPDDLVPSIGYPGSDVLLTAGLGGLHPDVPAMPTGRLNVVRNEEILVYLQKLKEFENQPAAGLWRKNLLHLSGGKSSGEIESLRSALQNLSPLVNRQLLGGRIAAINKTSPVEIENVNISRLVNDGLSVITFFGHASPTVTDLNIGYASQADNGLANATRYPLMYFNGCGVGNIFFRYNTLTTDWLLTPNRGSIAVLANSYWSFLESSRTHLQQLYSLLFAERQTLGWSLGRLQQELNRRVTLRPVDEFELSNLHQSILQGDPAVVINPLTKPDYQVEKSKLFLQSKNAASAIGRADSLQVGVILANLGLYDTLQRVGLRVRLTLQGGKIIEKNTALAAVAYQDTLLVGLKNEGPLQQIEVLADADRRVDELDENNNAATLLIDWEKVAQATTFPANIVPDRLPPALTVLFDEKRLKNGDFVANQPVIRISIKDDNALLSSDTTLLDLFLKSCEKCALLRVPARFINVANASDNELRGIYRPQNLAAGQYEMRAIASDARQNRTSYRINLEVAAQAVPTVIVAYPNPASLYVKFEALVQAPTAPETIEVTINDLLGRRVTHLQQPARVGLNTLLWTPTNLANGSYFYQMTLKHAQQPNEVKSGQIIFLK